MRLARIVLMPTLFPEPVDPAMRRWGIFARSSVNTSPAIVFPMASGRSAFASRNAVELMTLRIVTSERWEFGTLDADRRLPRDGGHDTDPLGRQLERHVVFKADDAADLDAACRDELVERDDRPGGDADAFQLDVEFRKRRTQKVRVRLQFLVVDVLFPRPGGVEEIDRGKHVIDLFR